MKLSRVIVFMLCLAMVAAVAGCGSQPTTEPNVPTDQPAKDGVYNADVVVVGGGLAGLSAAVKARESGAEVILIEKLAMLGGSSALSGGGLGATNTSVQRENGIEDSNESWKQLWEERQATSPRQSQYPDWKRVDWLIENSAASIDWYLSLGYQFRTPEGFGVDPVQRLHFPYPEGSGYVLTSFLENKATEMGVTILKETPATELITKDGAVVGVKAKAKSGDVTLNAKAVVLACGGFAHSEELIKRFTPEVADYMAYSYSGAGNYGDGIIMAEAVGAVTYEDNWLIGLGLKSPVQQMGSFYWYGTYVFINNDGERFTNEGGHYAIVYNDAVFKSPGGSWMLFDSGEAFAAFVQAAEDAGESENLYKADTLDALAAAIGADAAKLNATIEAYNQVAAGGTDAFGKPAMQCVPLTTGPFYAVRYYPSDMGTFGGVKTTDKFEVINASGNPIPGLFAAGEMCNRPFYNMVYMSGSALQVAALSGQTAGAGAAEYAKK
ncbi:MAG: FAD-dependent oxidoreductase [Christensenellales bacterium]